MRLLERTATVLLKFVEGISPLLLLVFCGVGIYQAANYYMPDLGRGADGIVVIAPLILLALTLDGMRGKSQ